MRLRSLLGAIALAAAFYPAQDSLADSPKDLETIALAVGFMNGGPSGAIAMDILFDPSNPDSVAHADEVAALTAGGVGKKVKLTGQKIDSVGALSSRAIFITRGAAAFYGDALQKAGSLNAITFSTDEACLGNGCVFTVKTDPSVDIFVSTAAAQQASTEFASAFNMMITKR